MKPILSKLKKAIRLSDDEKIQISPNKILIIVKPIAKNNCKLYSNYCSKKIRCITFKVKNGKLQFLDNNRILNGSENGDIEIYETSTANCINKLEGHAYGFNKMILGGDYLVSICANKEGRLWNIKNFQYIANFNANNNSVKDAYFSLENERVYIICQNGAISIHETRTGKSIQKIDYQKESVYQCHYQKESDNLFVWYRIKQIITCWRWDCKTFEKTQIQISHQLPRIDTIYSKDNIFVLVSENELNIVELQDDCFKKLFHYEPQYLRQIQFTNKQEVLVICYQGVIFYSFEMKKQLGILPQNFFFTTQLNDNFLLGLKKSSYELYYILGNE